MNQPAALPIPPDLAARYGRSREGRDWLASLPGIAGSLLEKWRLVSDLPPGSLPWNGHGAIVLPVCREYGSPAVLKIAFPHDEARREHHALALWQGRGAVALLDSDPDTCSMLLERLDAGRPLSGVPMADAVVVWGGLVPQLGLVPDDRRQWREFEHVAARAEQWSDDLPADWEQLGRPFPRWLLEAALEVCQTRGAVGRRSARDVLVHTDLHFLNILARPDAPAGEATSPAGYAAIDPQPMIGEAEFAVAPLLWNRLQDLPLNHPESGLRQRCAEFSSAAGLDPEAARQWAVVREVANALAYAGKPGHRGDLARSLWVASTLAGRTLDGLPPAHALPEPGQAALEG
ncbi:streptomycin 6-kinase [Pseudarthrobacter phenanthrenivorans Sphe3]|uniref:Streptomycin 6-kinase n=1 Tax=Pseudarthrobacter phenanthrenivorans (strain DSM 18606 / JCM 16027 / LMG 23796 / Sphe3) TaxID=930171 RepID=F0M7B9_PSEPM|nr:aminoglycoside phosphotransferase family protein [Pseudarthrobacter phenanthrenivorans]ADX72573.1 streptomycin 6-kinase [Pseudarthrobacter phenanthrenivorans Sphe3]